MNTLNKIDFLLKKLFNLNRSLISKDNIKTLNYIKKEIPINIIGLKSGTKVFDWKVPKEWIIDEAYIADIHNKKIIDFKNNFLHVLGYSRKINKVLTFDKLKKNIYLSKKLPSSIPYRTSYYKKNWGFCVNLNQYKDLKKRKKLKVRIKSRFENGKMLIGELLVKGKSKKEILISTYICHPNMANDNLSGIILNTLLAKKLFKKNLNWSYRFVFHPETIGALVHLKLRSKQLKNVIGGFVLSCVGGKGQYFYKKSFDENHFINKLVINYFKTKNIKLNVSNFDIHGSDERQYSSQGFKINLSTISKSKYYEYKEYHTSKDDLNFVNKENIYKTYKLYLDIINLIEKQEIYENTVKFGEPKLSNYNLYPSIGGSILPNKKNINYLDYILWILFYSDGKRTKEQIFQELNLKRKIYNKILDLLIKKKLLKKI
tara:strand:+ start:841 stop:2130 length:1290 start_codon:yes stop_codon:yes gene_type:complete